MHAFSKMLHSLLGTDSHFPPELFLNAWLGNNIDRKLILVGYIKKCHVYRRYKGERNVFQYDFIRTRSI